MNQTTIKNNNIINMNNKIKVISAPKSFTPNLTLKVIDNSI